MRWLLYTQNDVFAEGFLCRSVYIAPSQTPQYLYTQNDAFAEGFLCRSVYSSPRRRAGFCIRKMMFLLRTPAQKRIQHLSQTPQLLYTQNDVFAEAFCTDAYTLSAQCTCFRSKLLCRCVHIAPRRRLSICIRKMMFLLKLSAHKRIHRPLADAQASVYAK